MKTSAILPSLAAGLTALVALSAHSDSLDAYLHAFASTPDNKQMVIRLPMHQQSSGKLIGQIVDDIHKSELSGATHAWERVGEYTEECPTESKGKLQHMLVLKDNSILFTCERSRFFIKHPNRGELAEFDPAITDANTPRQQIVSYRYPELKIDITDMLTAEFDDKFDKDNFNKDYGISASYNKVDDVVYLGIEDKIYVLDLRKLEAVSGDKEALDRKEYFYSLKDQGKTVVALKAETPTERAQIISMALVRDNAISAPYLFTSSSTRDKKDAPTPVSRLTLSNDGRSVTLQEEPQLAVAWQWARLDWEPDGAPKGKGLKGDVTYLASDIAIGTEPVLIAHLHHNHIGVVNNPHTSSLPISRIITTLRQSTEGLTANNFNPDIFNAITRNPDYQTDSSSAIQTMTRIQNYVVPVTDLKPNVYSYAERIYARVAKNKPPKRPLNNDVLAVYNGHAYSFPWKDDVTQAVMVHPLGEGGWKNNTLAVEDWAISAQLPDVLYRQRTGEPLYTEEVLKNPDGSDRGIQYHQGNQRFNMHKENLPDWHVTAPYWSAFHITPANSE